MQDKVFHAFSDKLIFLCIFLACLVPRYISTFKIPVGNNISFYTVFVVIVWLTFVKKITIHKKLESYFFLIWIFFIIASGWRAEKAGVWMSYVLWSVTALLLQQILFSGLNKKTFDVIIEAFVGSLFLHLLMGLYEITTHRYIFEIGPVNEIESYGNVAIGMFYNLNDYATFVMTMFPFSVYKFFNQKGIFKRLYYGTVVGLSVYLLIKSGSRAVVLALVFVSFFSCYLFFRKYLDNKLKYVCIAFGLALLPFVFFTAQSYIMTFLRFNMVNANASNDIARINLIRNGLYFLKETYGLGVGAGNLYLWLAERSIYPIGHLRFIHNWYLEILVTFGVLFFIIYMAFHSKVFFSLLKSINNDSIWSRNNIILLSFISFSVVCISSSSNVYSEWVWMYLVFVSTYCLFIAGTLDNKLTVFLKEQNNKEKVTQNE